MDYIPVCVVNIMRQVNRDIYLLAIRCEFVWESGIERQNPMYRYLTLQRLPAHSFTILRLKFNLRDQ
jgi:hypothetical protein